MTRRKVPETTCPSCGLTAERFHVLLEAEAREAEALRDVKQLHDAAVETEAKLEAMAGSSSRWEAASKELMDEVTHLRSVVEKAEAREAALDEAARSLETIAGSSLKGRCHLTIREIQAYAGNRASVARAALAVKEGK